MTRPSHFILTDTEDLTAISGYAGNLNRINVARYEFTELWEEIPAATSGDIFTGIRSIKWEEKSDKPCWIEVTPWPLNSRMVKNTLNPRYPPKKAVELCTNSYRGDLKKVFVRGYVKAIAACTTDKKSSSKNRLKGIKIWGATLSKQAPFVRDIPGTPEMDAHRSCNGNWHPRVSCPMGYIASGIKIYDYQSRYSRGLGLKCRKVELSTSPFK